MRDALTTRAHALFMRALDVEASKREEFVIQSCRGDEALLGRVRRLVDAVDCSTDFLETPALQAAPPNAAAGAGGPATIAVPGYRVVGVIGVGGMATVYEAVQERPTRTVALKIMSRALANTSAVRRFKYETEVLALLRHPGIAQIFGAGTCDDGFGHVLPFFAMEYVEGARTIVEHADHRSLPLRERLRIFLDVCEAVQHGHRLGVVHRDLKPANILVDAAGRIKIIDFGVARSTNADHAGITHRVDAGGLIGTLNSMSPEQCAGAPDIDARTDVYSLGVLLYQLVAGRLPHDLSKTSIPQAVRTIMEEQPPRLASIAPEAKGDLEAIVMTAMEKDRSRRYGGAGALAADVRRFLNHQAIDARPPTMVHQMRLFAKRHRLFVAAGAAILAVLLSASALITVFSYRANAEAQRRWHAEQAALKERDVALRQAYIASIAGAFASYSAGEPAQVRRRLNAAPIGLRNWEWALVSALVERGERTIRAHEDMIFAFAQSPDGRLLATGSRDGSLAVWDAETGGCLTTIPAAEGGPVHALSFMPDNRRLVGVTEDNMIRAWDTESGRLLTRIPGVDDMPQSVACGPNGLVAVGARDGVARLWRLDSSQPVHTFADQPGGINGIGFSDRGDMMVTWGRPGTVWLRSADGREIRHRLNLDVAVQCIAISADGAFVAAGGAEGRIRVWRADDGTLILDAAAPDGITSIRALAFTPDSQHLAAGQIDRAIFVWNIEQKAIVDTRLGHDEAVSGLAFSRDGDYLYSGSWDRTLRIWPMHGEPSSGPLQSLAGHEDHVLSVAFSPDGRVIASAGRDDTIRLWDSILGEPLATLTGHAGDVNAVAFSPDGELIASASSDGTIRLWNLSNIGQPRTITTAEGTCWTLCFSADGNHLAIASSPGIVSVFAVESGTRVLQFSAHEERINALKYSPDGSRIATASRDGDVRMWDAATGSLNSVCTGHQSDVFALAFDASGERLYSGARDQTVRIWKVATGEFIESLPAEGQFITSVSISPDGTRLAAGSYFSEILLWDLESNDLVASFKGHNSAIRSIAFSPDGNSIVCGGYDRALGLYNVKPRNQRTRDIQRARAAREKVTAALAEMTSSSPGVEEVLAVIDAESRNDPEVRYWVQNLLLQRSAAERIESGVRPAP